MKKLGIAMALAVTVSGCYGPFNLTRKFYQWQDEAGTSVSGKSVDKKWGQEGVFLITGIAYAVTFLGDLVIFNSIEFWGGKNPITAKNVKSIQVGDQQEVLSYAPAEHRLRMDAFEKGRLVKSVLFQVRPDGMQACDASGNVLFNGRMRDGLVVLSDPSGQELAKYDPATLQAAR